MKQQLFSFRISATWAFEGLVTSLARLASFIGSVEAASGLRRRSELAALTIESMVLGLPPGSRPELDAAILRYF